MVIRKLLMKLLIQLKTLTCLVKIAEEHRESLQIVTKAKKKKKKSEHSFHYSLTNFLSSLPFAHGNID